MFVKLLKHEWRASRGLVGLLCAIIAVSGLLLGGSLRYIVWSAAMGHSSLMTVYAVILALAELAIFGCFFLAMYLLAYRFYKSRFTEQGYLMLTLPVTTHQQLLSSIVNTIIGVLLVGMTAIASVSVAIGAFLNVFKEPPTEAVWQFLREVRQNLTQTMGLSGGTMILPVLKMLISFLADLILLMLALTVGAQAQKHPVLKGAAVYIVTDILVSGGCDLLSEWVDIPNLTVVISCIIYGSLAVAAYFIMHNIIDKRLNLT